MFERKTIRGYQVQARFIIAQKEAVCELKTFSLLLDGKLSFQKSYCGHNLTINFPFFKKSLKYFSQFPLKTKKRISLIKFLSVYKLLIRAKTEKRMLTTEELIFIKKRVKKINPD